MFWHFLFAIVIGLIAYQLGTYSVIISMATVTFKFFAVALILLALFALYRHVRSRRRTPLP